MIYLTDTGLSDNHTDNNYVSNDRESGSTESLHEHEENRKSYPQRNNRAKLNYRDLERGMFEEIRQSIWAFGGSTTNNKNGKNNNEYRGHVHEVIDLSIDDDDDDGDTNQINRHLCCICDKPSDHSRLMLQCNSCANWHHGDCIKVTKEQARAPEVNGDQFTCPSCQGLSNSITKSALSPDQSIPTKRKHFSSVSTEDNNKIEETGKSSKSISYDKSTKRSKHDSFCEPDLLAENQVRCIIDDCNEWAKSDWIYCSSACIRRHINETLQAIQQSKGAGNEDIPSRNDLLLYNKKTYEILETNLVPQIEDLCSWINQHPSYALFKPSSNQSVLSTAKSSVSSSRSTSSLIETPNRKPPPTLTVSTPRTDTKSILKKTTPTQLGKPTKHTQANVNNIDDIRSKVPTALYDKIIMRLEKKGEKDFIKKDIRVMVTAIEEEMFRVYGKVDKSYKNKFRSLLANISNMNNNFFYQQLLSKKITAIEIVAMKAEDMLPPEEKEKRKDQFVKEVQMILDAEQQTAEELARRSRIKVTRQGLVDNDACLPMFISTEKCPSKDKITVDQSANPTENCIEIKPLEKNSINRMPTSTIGLTSEKSTKKLKSATQASSSTRHGNPPLKSSTKKTYANEPSKILPSQQPISEQVNPIFLADDLDNDYIEPESPTGVDALIYDENDENDNLDMAATASHSSISHSPPDNTDDVIPCQPIIRDDYNPSKVQNEITPLYPSIPIVRAPNQWHGEIHSSDTKLFCQSTHIYGESGYLIEKIPDQLIILGRLRLGDLWDYIRESSTVRDLLILTLTSLSINNDEKFLQYVDSITKSGRAAVINKCTNSTLIRDMYVLAADTKDCPPSILSSLALPTVFESKQLFLVIIGSGKRTTKSTNHSHHNYLSNQQTDTPIAVRNSTVTRDPRLLKHKDPRIRESNSKTDLIFPQVSQPIRTNQTFNQYSNGDPSVHYTEQLRGITAERQTDQEKTLLPVSSTIVAGDNLVEENMDVDDDQDEKHKKQITTTITNGKKRRKSRFSDILPSDEDRTLKLKSTRICSNDEKNKFTLVNSNVRTNNKEITSIKPADACTNRSLTDKFWPITNSTNSFVPSTNTKDKLTSKSIRFSLSKSLSQLDKATSIIPNDIDESSSTLLGESNKQDSSSGHGSSPSPNSNWTKQISSGTPVHSTTIWSFIMKEQKTKDRSSSSTNKWGANSYDNNYMAEYYDFDRPQE